jgi:hypothetical protein
MGTSINDNDDKISVFTLPISFQKRKSHSFKHVFLEILSQRPFFLITPSVMSRSQYYKNNSKFDSRYRSSADYGMWFEIMQKGDLYIIDENLIHYRTHDQQWTQSAIKENYKIPDCIPLYRDYAQKSKLFKKGYNFSYYKLMLVQSIKLNNIGRFKKGQIFLRMILKENKKYFFPWIIMYLFLNFLRIKFSLNNLLIVKNKLKK